MERDRGDNESRFLTVGCHGLQSCQLSWLGELSAMNRYILLSWLGELSVVMAWRGVSCHGLERCHGLEVSVIMAWRGIST